MLEIHLDANTNLECCYKALTAPQIQIQGDLFSPVTYLIESIFFIFGKIVFSYQLCGHLTVDVICPLGDIDCVRPSNV